MKRRTFHLMLAAVAIVLMTGCEREARLTSSFGDGVVSGQVVLGGDFAGQSPAGIEVAVPGTGMEMTVAGDGRFLFSGVPEDASLRFRKGSDIDVTLDLGRVQTNLTVEVDGMGARRRRSVRVNNVQLEGLVVDVTADSITVDAAGKGEVTALIDGATLVRDGQEMLTPEDVLLGSRVHVKADVLGSDLLAREIRLQNEIGENDGEGGEGQLKVELEGLILTVGEETLQVDAAGKGPTDVVVTEETVIRHGNRMMELSDLEEGDRVHVRAWREEEGLVASLILVQNQKGGGNDDDDGDDGEEDDGKVELEGLITAVSESGIVVNAAGKGETEVVITEDTVIRHGNTRYEASDLNVGDRVHVRGEKSGDTIEALLIILQRRA